MYFDISLGPIAGAWVAQKSNWRWIFRSTTILCAIVQANGFILLRESEHNRRSSLSSKSNYHRYYFLAFPPELLEARAKKIRIGMGLDRNDRSRVRTFFDSEERQCAYFLRNVLSYSDEYQLEADCKKGCHKAVCPYLPWTDSSTIRHIQCFHVCCTYINILSHYWRRLSIDMARSLSFVPDFDS